MKKNEKILIEKECKKKNLLKILNKKKMKVNLI